VHPHDVQYKAQWTVSLNGGRPKPDGPYTIQCDDDGTCFTVGNNMSQRDILTYPVNLYGAPPTQLVQGASWNVPMGAALTGGFDGQAQVRVASIDASGVATLMVNFQGTGPDKSFPEAGPATMTLHETLTFKDGYMQQVKHDTKDTIDDGKHAVISRETITLVKHTP
jgi:hypothetical protein